MRLSLRTPRFLAAALHPDIPSDPALCPNCGSRFAEPRPNYCGECGQESRLRAPTLGEFGQQLGGAYISMEGALWRTLWRLFLLPGQLTLEYFAGRRRRYVLPLRLYLTISVLALLVLRLVTAPQLEAQAESDAREAAETAAAASAPASGSARPPAPTAKARPSVVELEPDEEQNFQVGGLAGMRFGIKNKKFFCERLPESMCKRLEKRLAHGREHLKQEILGVILRSLNNLGATMFALLPAFALWLKLIFMDKRLRYTEHLVFALHLHAFWFAMLMLMLVPLSGLQGSAWLATMVYPLVAIQRVYRTRWWSTLLRAALLALLNLFVTTLTVALLFLATLVS
ncbi:DUF3667 domain-containing protein [Paucibacter sp. DJ1R-11]|uniref:DUF3667 domain-containing protein n=1 Tax=Paucibacter sp. DJ1R-11 TaxID=2893556 RepID=UPI0021E40F24|nr:DUF3667 domain-containing protein [Paucibacter sp. DJ1R-11]MCV2363427.1 DUF3667 domain-containing protein [Paucibacter sp. DJ1R-11]